MNTSIAAFSDIEGWQHALYAFLIEKERRSGSMRTVESYSRMLTYFSDEQASRPTKSQPRTFSLAPMVKDNRVGNRLPSQSMLASPV